MKAISIFVGLYLLFGPASSQAEILDFKQIKIAFTDVADARSNATWSEPDKITVTDAGLGWDGDGASSRDGWIQTKPIALGLSWRPTIAISVRARIQPPPREYTLANGQKSTGDAGEMYVRYSPDLKHWSSWQALQRADPQSIEEKKTPGRYYGGTIRVPNRDRSEYGQLVSEYSRMDVPWKSDEEAAVQWILARQPDFFAKQIPFIGYVEFLFEGEFRGSQRIQSLQVDISYGMGGMHAMPRDESVYRNRDVPWRYKDSNSPKTETNAPAAGAPPRR